MPEITVLFTPQEIDVIYDVHMDPVADAGLTREQFVERWIESNKSRSIGRYAKREGEKRAKEIQEEMKKVKE